MRVEQGRGEALLALGEAELHTKPLEPFASIVGNEALQGDKVDEMPRILRGLEQLPSLIGDFPGGVDVAVEVGQVSLRARRIALSAASPSWESPARAARAVSKSPVNPAARASRARTSRCSVPLVTATASWYAWTASGSPRASSRSPRRASKRGRSAGPA